MVRLISQVHQSLCNKYFILTLNTGKSAHVVATPDAQAIAVPTLREVMEHRYDAEVSNDCSPLGRPRIDAVGS
jgi:hypothetical protein